VWYLPPDMPDPIDPHDPDYQLGALIGAMVALLLALPIFWWFLSE
jgi:hypothetical protein